MVISPQRTPQDLDVHGPIQVPKNTHNLTQKTKLTSGHLPSYHGAGQDRTGQGEKREGEDSCGRAGGQVGYELNSLKSGVP